MRSKEEKQRGEAKRRSEACERSEALYGRVCIFGIWMSRSRRKATHKRSVSPRVGLNACVLHVIPETQLSANAFRSRPKCNGALRSLVFGPHSCV